MAQGPIGVNILSNVVGIGGSNVSAFGDMVVVNNTPVVQLDFVYGINTQTGTTSITTTGVADTDTKRLRLQSGVGAAGAATFTSIRIARYRAGQGIMARFTAVWTTSAANSTQVVGVGGTGTGYFFGYNGAAFGISRRAGGTDNWVAQTSWNGDRCDGAGASGFAWNKAFGNVMMIRYPYLGYGDITFWVQNPPTGAWILCHTIQYANTTDLVQVDNPSMPFYANVVNAGSTTNLIMYVGSVGIFLSGQREYLGAQYGVNSLKTNVTTELNILSLRNATTYNTLANTGLIRLRSLSFSSDDGNGSSILTIKTGVTLGGTPAFTTVNGTTANNGVTITAGNSIASFDVAGTTITNGVQIFNSTVARNSESYMDLTPYNIFIAPGQTATFSITNQASADNRVAINWNEDV